MVLRRSPSVASCEIALGEMRSSGGEWCDRDRKPIAFRLPWPDRSPKIAPKDCPISFPDKG
ncbi:hypothetical protein AMR42_12870 [Limnothrix sp. PR1529]|nr:hypothetical protein AMR42_12870 [Limnothrix sp. PR1529]